MEVGSIGVSLDEVGEIANRRRVTAMSEIRVIDDGNEGADRVGGMGTANGSGEDDKTTANKSKKASAELDFVIMETFIGMHAAGKAEDCAAGNCAEDDVPTVANNGRGEEPGNVGKRE